MNRNMEGAGRYDKLHGDEGLVEVTDAHRAQAKTDILETIELFGQYPQPSYSKEFRQHRRVRFDLADYISEECDPGKVANDLAWLITTYGLDRMEAIDKVRDKIMEMVAADPYIDALADEVAGEIAQQEREDA